MRTKIIVKNAVKKRGGYMYYIDVKGNLCEQKLVKPKRRYLQFKVYDDDIGNITVVYSKIGNKKTAVGR